jgi:transposase
VLTLKSKKPLKKIKDEILTNDKIELMFYDEAFFRRESTIIRGWYPRGNKSTVDCPATKEKTGVCGAVNPRDGRLLSLVFDGFDSDTFLYYLKWLLRELKTRKKIVLVLDNATSHKSNKVVEFVSKHEKRLDLLFLPPYSPELNPIERVWKNLRYLVTHNTYFENLETLENAVAKYLKDHFEPNKQLASLCCI